MNQKIRVLFIPLLVIMMSSLLLGFNKAKDEIVIKADEVIVYQCEKLDNIISLANSDKDEAHSLYNNKYYCVTAHVNSIASNNKKFTICSVDSLDGTSITCTTTDADIINQISTIANGDTVLLYCKLSVNNSGKVSVSSIQTVKTIDDNYAIQNTMFSLATGEMFDIDKAQIRTLGDGKITYYINSNWQTVEYDIPDVANRYEIDGYYYKLNEIESDFDVKPEDVFVFYFDNNEFLENNSRDFDKTLAIEKAIVENIIADGTVNINKHKVDYGISLDYCVTGYHDVNEIYHRVEFVFSPVGDNEGFLVLMYVYSDANHVNDLLFFLRTMQLK